MEQQRQEDQYLFKTTVQERETKAILQQRTHEKVKPLPQPQLGTSRPYRPKHHSKQQRRQRSTISPGSVDIDREGGHQAGGGTNQVRAQEQTTEERGGRNGNVTK